MVFFKNYFDCLSSNAFINKVIRKMRVVSTKSREKWKIIVNTRDNVNTLVSRVHSLML